MLVLKHVGLFGLLSLNVLALTPTIEKRAVPSAITPAQLNLFKFYQQYAAASYCPNNNNSTGSAITCLPGICTNITTVNVLSIQEFQNTLIFDTTGYIALDTYHKLIIVSFRGSISLKNWLFADAYTQLKDAPELCTGCQVFGAMYNAWKEIRDYPVPNPFFYFRGAVKSAYDAHPGFTVLVTGHSLGAALATFAAVEFRNAGMNTTLASFASPRAGNPTFAAYITAQASGTFNQNYRITHLDDPIPNYPPESQGYKHPTPEYYINTNTSQPVNSPSDVVKCVTIQDGNDHCNANHSTTHIEAHGWYFNNINACYQLGIIDWFVGWFV